ncbi:MAG TPA: hypothetical protein VJN92_13375, partial [Candidatus Acidoferrum sp.]|nr:hypothetical protein [Candidatus Acidoferrum sp.]
PLSFAMTLALLGLLTSPSLHAQNPAWDSLKQLTNGQKIRVVLNDTKSYKGEFRSISDEAILIHTRGADQSVLRQSIKQVYSKRPGHRGRHALIGAAIGAGAGLGTGAAIDADCSPQSIVCTGNKGKAILTPLFGLLGAAIGAALPAGNWQEVYRSD